MHNFLVQPDSGFVMVQTSVNRTPTDMDAKIERDALRRGVLTSLVGPTAEYPNDLIALRGENDASKFFSYE
jgi:hypothetical protein